MEEGKTASQGAVNCPPHSRYLIQPQGELYGCNNGVSFAATNVMESVVLGVEPLLKG